MNLYIDGQKIAAGTVIYDFRGEPATFKFVSRESEPGKSGKVIVGRFDASDLGHFDSELYPTVFDGEIR